MTDRRIACIIICAFKGDVRAARGVVAKAIREVCGNEPHHSEPHFINYMSAEAWRGETGEADAEPRYFVEMTDAECEAFGNAATRIAKEAGFNRVPMDVYHD